MKEELKLMLVLRPTKVSSVPLDLFSVNHDEQYWSDFEYNPTDIDTEDKLVDGYEVNIFEPLPQSVSNIDEYLPSFTVDKKFLSKSFIGDRNPGDVGLLTMTFGKGSITADSKFSKETMNDFFPSIYAFYTNFENLYFSHPEDISAVHFKYPLDMDGVHKIYNLLLATNRELKINILNDK